MFGSISSEMIMAILPEISILLVIAIVFIADLVISEERRPLLAWLTIAGLAITLVLTVLFSQPGRQGELIWGGMLRHDWLAFVSKTIFITAALFVTIFAANWKGLWQKGEFYLLLLTSTMGMTLMASSADLIMLFLAIETTSIPLYILAGFLIDDDRSTEAGFKYFLFGAMTTAVMLYGFSLLFGFTGHTGLTEIGAAIASGEIPAVALLGSSILVLVGFGFKASLVPLHFWAPDVYEGAPTPVTAFLSTASKAAGFVALTRLMIAVYPSVESQWVNFVAVAAAVTMTVGNLIALSQTNIKRLLAYSSIAHAGYALLGVAAASVLGVTSVIYYFLAYVVTNLTAFGVVMVASQTLKSDEIADYAGLSRRSPTLALIMLIAFLSLTGVPPLGGFIAKLLVFAAAVEADLIWLAVVGVLNAIVGLYYYMIVLKVIYLYDTDKPDQAVPSTRMQMGALLTGVVLIILLGTVIAPWYDLALASANGLF